MYRLLSRRLIPSSRQLDLFSSQFLRNLFIQTEPTPNPESLKFLPGRTVYTYDPSLYEDPSPGQSPPQEQPESLKADEDTARGYYATRSDKLEISKSPLMQLLFKIDGVKSVYLGQDFITVNKYAEANWSHVRTPIFSAIMDHYASGQPTVVATPQISDTTILDTDSEVVAMIKEILETRIRPAVQEDGGDIRYIGFDESTGIVSVKLAGSCVGCPSSSVTLKNGVENMMMHYIPEVSGVQAIEESEEEESAISYQPKQGDTKGMIDSHNNSSADTQKMKTYEQRLAAAGIPFSD